MTAKRSLFAMVFLLFPSLLLGSDRHDVFAEQAVVSSLAFFRQASAQVRQRVTKFEMEFRAGL